MGKIRLSDPLPKGWKWGWKVCSKVSGRYHSSDCGNVRYTLGQITVPETGNGPLCVFTTLAAAKCFSGTFMPVFVCKYKPSRQNKVWMRYGPGLRLVSERALELLPFGKALASAVVILKKVKQ